ncbi:hypothetical protein ACP70R_021990 [Stipagrostis hirtigluma subsp. patula]
MAISTGKRWPRAIGSWQFHAGEITSKPPRWIVEIGDFSRSRSDFWWLERIQA